MFMFWSKRTLLTRRLLKAKVRGEHETECETQENHNFIPYSNTSEINIPKCGSSSGIYIGGGSCNNCCSTESPASGNLSNRKNRQSRSTICCSCCCCCSKKNSSTSRSCYGGLLSASGGGESVGVKSKSGVLAAAAEEEEQEEKFCCCFGEEETSCCITDNKKGSNLQSRYSPSNDYHHHHHHHNYQQQQPSRRDDNNHHAPGILANDDHHQQNVDQTNVRLVRCKEILKSLKENQLEMLLAAIESYGADLGSCVLVPRRRKSGPSTMTPTSEDPESIQMTPCSPPQSDRNPRCYPHRHHHHHHHHHHNRRQRQGDQPVQRDIDQEENLPLDERVSTATTTTAVTSRLLPRGERNRSRTSGTANELQIEPHLLFCQIWRWPDLVTTSELKRLPVCHSVEDPVYVCCNPYHWSRLCKPESPPPPYCLIADRLRPEDRAPSEGGGGGGGKGEERCSVGVEGYETLQGYERNTNSPPFTGSLTTNGEDVSEQREWCTLAYWELGGRVGRLYPVEPSTVNVFDSLLDGDGLCLATLAENHSSASPAIERTRSKIGLGLMLSQESDGVWAYNRSENPIFVNSPTLDDPESRTLLVYRVPPGFCLNIFDRAKTLNKQHNHQQQGCGVPPSQIGFSSGPVDVNSVRISFAKGWGPKYSRQEVTSCPCWLEVLLAPCR